MKKKYLERLQVNISNSYCKKRKIACIFNQHNSFDSLIRSSLSSILECSYKKAFKYLFKIPL